MNLSFVFGGIGRALAVRSYRHYFVGNFASTIGRWAHRVGVGWLTWELTRSEAWLGIIAFADLFPAIIVPVVAGVATDRIGFVPIIKLSAVWGALVATVLAVLTALGAITVEIVVALTALMSIVDAASGPARISIVHTIVPREVSSASIALNTASFNAARLIGPALAGPLILWTNVASVFAVNAASYVLFLGLVWRLDAGQPDTRAGARRGLAADIGEAIAAIVQARGIRFMMILLAATALLVRPVIEFLPGFAAKVFGGGPGELSLLLSSLGFGAMVSSLWLARRGEVRGLTRLVVMAYLVTALALVLFAATDAIWIATICIVAVGFFLLVGNIGAQSLIQSVVAGHLRARVMSLYMVIAFGFPAIGALAMGWVATFAGLQLTIGGGGLVAALLWIWARRVQAEVAAELERPD